MSDEAPDADDDLLKPVDLDSTTAVKREQFHATRADGLAKAVGMDVKRSNKATEKFAYYQDSDQLALMRRFEVKRVTARSYKLV